MKYSIYITPKQWFPKCAPRIPGDPRPVARGYVGTFKFEVLSKIIMELL